MRRAIFRADASSSLGIGHVLRCLAFADGLANRGVGSVFVTRGFDRRIARLIRSRGHSVEETPPEVPHSKDVRLTQAVADRHGATLIVTDLCSRPALANLDELNAYHRALASARFTICLAGGSAIDLPADVVVSPYFRTTHPNLPDDGGRVLLLGVSYFIFRREFTEAAKAPRAVAEEARRVLVTIGGSDELHLTTKVVRALSVLDGPTLTLRIVIGPAYPRALKREVADLLSSFRGKFAFLDHRANMAQAMLWADLAITGDGLTKYETAVAGTPSIMLSRFDSDEALNNEFEKAGTTVHAGDGGLIDAGLLAERIRLVQRDASLRASMSQRGKMLMDGMGLERIIAHIPDACLDER